MVALTLLYGARQAGIDNACHIGGLIAGGAMGWQRARLSGQNRLVTEGGIIVAGSLLLTGAIWLRSSRLMSQFYKSGKACVKSFIRRRLNKSDDKNNS